MDRLAWSALLLCVTVIARLLGPIEATLASLLMGLGLAGWVAFAGSSPSGGGFLARIGRFIPACAAFLCLTRVEDPAARLAIVALAALATPVAHNRAAAGFAAAVAAGRALAAILPGAWSIPVALSRTLSSGLGMIVRSPVDAGPTATGLWLFLIWLAAVAACRGAGARVGLSRCLLAFACVCLNAATLHWDTGAPAALLAAHHEAVSTPQGTFVLLFLRGPILLLILCALLPRLPVPPRAVSHHGSEGRARLAGFGAAAAGAIFALSLWAAGAPTGARRAGDIVLRLSDAVDMQIPARGRYGIANAGMFGMLPRYLALDGLRARVAPQPLDPAVLEGAAAAVVVMPTARLDAAEKAAIHAFVARGGALLVLGDHTDLLSTMAPINDLTARYGLRIRFDSAFAARGQWAGCLAGAGRFAASGVGTGASLAIRGGALPILTAPYAFSDAGDRANAGQGAFFGDKRWRAGEQVGDLVLAAAARSGRGRVVLFGDTSSFQNLMLPWSWEYVAALFDDLLRDRVGGAIPVAAAAFCATLLAALALGGRAAAAAALALALLVQALLPQAGALLPQAGALLPQAGALLAQTGAGAFLTDPSPLRRLVSAPEAGRIALIDDAHKNRYARHLWRERSIGGLVVNLQRLGMLPIISREGFARPLPHGSLALLIEPRAPLSRGEIARLEAHRAGGGALLIAATGHASAVLDDLLAPRGMHLRRLPLGPVPVRGDLDVASYARALSEPQFRDAWPVQGPAGARSHFAAFGHDIVLEAPRDVAAPGRLIVVGDADFLTDRVLENETNAWPGNVAFLERLLEGEEGR